MTEKQYDILSKELKLCCADSSVGQMIVDAMKRLEDSENSYSTDPTNQLINLWLEDLGLSEHGTSIRGSWLTDEGRKVLHAFETETAEQCEYCGGWYVLKPCCLPLEKQVGEEAVR